MKKMMKFIHKINKNNITKGVRYIRRNGFHGLSVVLKSHVQDSIHYNEWFLQHRITSEQIEKQRSYVFPYQPKISLLVPAFRTPT